MGCHGGAGVTTLASLGLGHDGGRVPNWPVVPALPAGVLLVARLSAAGMRAAGEAIEVWLSGKAPPGLHLFGLLVVAAGPGRRVPEVARDRLELVTGWLVNDIQATVQRRLWRIPWVDELLGLDYDLVRTCQPLIDAIPDDLKRWLLGRTR